MPRPNQTSILHKLMFVTMSTVVLTLALLAIILGLNGWISFRKMDIRSITTLAGVVGTNSTAAIEFGDKKVASEILAGLNAEQEIILGCIYSKGGELLAAYRPHSFSPECQRSPPAHGYRFSDGMLAISMGILHGTERIGDIQLISDRRYFFRTLKLYGALITGLTLGASLFAYWLASRLRHLVTQPINRLASTMGTISSQGTFHLRAPQATEVEINDLVRSFNRMLDTIEDREAALRHSEEQFRATFEIAAVGESLLTPSGRYYRVNLELCKMLGYSADELSQLTFLQITYPEDKKISEDGWSRLMSGEISTFVGEKRYLTKNRQVLWALVSAAPIRDASGQVATVISVIQNVTERKLAEEERDRLLNREREARIEAEKSVRVRDDFLAIASHELRTPLTPLKIHLSLLEKGLRRLDVESLRQLRVPLQIFESAKKQLTNLERLVEDLLDVSRITAGRLILNREKVELSEVVREVIKRFSLMEGRPAHQIHFTVRQKSEGFWDRMRLDQIVTNLVSNAIKYGGNNPIEVTVATASGQATVTVTDQGIGISKEEQRKIFDRFERAAPIQHYSGLGLGLYICRELVLAHGGVIEVQSEPGKGATFTVTLPLNPHDSTSEPS